MPNRDSETSARLRGQPLCRAGRGVYGACWLKIHARPNISARQSFSHVANATETAKLKQSIRCHSFLGETLREPVRRAQHNTRLQRIKCVTRQPTRLSKLTRIDRDPGPSVGARIVPVMLFTDRRGTLLASSLLITSPRRLGLLLFPRLLQGYATNDNVVSRWGKKMATPL